MSNEFKPYFISKLEIKGKENIHYIFYFIDGEKTIDYSKTKIDVKSIEQPIQQHQVIQDTSGCIPQGIKLKLYISRFSFKNHL